MTNEKRKAYMSIYKANRYKNDKEFRDKHKELCRKVARHAYAEGKLWSQKHPAKAKAYMTAYFKSEKGKFAKWKSYHTNRCKCHPRESNLKLGINDWMNRHE